MSERERERGRESEREKEEEKTERQLELARQESNDNCTSSLWHFSVPLK